MRKFAYPWFAAFLALAGAPVSNAQTTWDGGGASSSWGDAANWNNDTLPSFNGADSLSITTGFTSGAAMTLGADRSIGRLTFGGGTTAISLSNNTLRLNSTTTTAAAGTALWNASTNDNVQATVNSAILLQSGAAGSYTGFFRENNNSNGGTKFNGAITQGAGENWTLRFSRSGARGTFGLNNAGNSISAIRNDGADVYSDVVGSFGGAALTLAGGFTGTRLTDHYTAPVSNSLTLAGNSQFASQIQTRLTGSMTQGASALTYGFAGTGAVGNGTLTRLEYSSFGGSGTTTLVGGALSTNSMSNLSTGALELGTTSGSSAVLVLSGASGNNVPTWADFSTAKTNNQAGGAGNWRINTGTTMTNTGNYGGFAALGADLVIPASGGGLSNTTFARSFQLGSAATLDGAQYATNSVTVLTDIAYGSVAGANRTFAVAANAGSSKTTTQLTLAGPVHELAGTISGDSVVMYPTGLSNSQMGMVRISGNNSLTGTSRWILGGNRSAFTTLGGGSIAAGANAADLSSIVAIFTSDTAFGGATEVNVASQNSSSQNPSGTLLFEDVNGSGSTTFARNFNLQNNNQSSAVPAWGSYAGDVIYTGTATMGGLVAGANSSIIHVQAGTLSLGVAAGSPAQITNNMTGATTINKSGAGVLNINNLTVGGSQATTNWNVRQGTLGGTGSIGGNLTVSSGSSLAPGNSTGTFDVGGALTLESTANLVIELGGATPGDGGTFYDQVNVAGNGTLTGSALSLSLANGYSPLSSDIFYILSLGGSLTGTFAGLAEGASLSIGGYTGQITYLADWTGTQAGSALTGGNDVAIYNLTIPEPGPILLVLIGVAFFALRRRR